MEEDELTLFRGLMKRMNEGSHDAAWTLVERYEPHIRAVVRRKLSNKIRPMFDTGDFVQAVWVSLFRMRKRMDEVETPEEFVGFLAAMARNKVIDEFRKRTKTAKHDVNRLQSMNASNAVGPSGFVGSPITPSQVAVAREQWMRLVEDQPNHYRRILELRLAGATYNEIATQVQVHERTARRVVDNVLRTHESRIAEHSQERN